MIRGHLADRHAQQGTVHLVLEFCHPALSLVFFQPTGIADPWDFRLGGQQSRLIWPSDSQHPQLLFPLSSWDLRT